MPNNPTTDTAIPAFTDTVKAEAARLTAAIAANGADLRHAYEVADAAADDNGYGAMTKAAALVNLTPTTLATWSPKAKEAGPVELAIRAAHNAADPFHSPAGRAMLSSALALAVAAVPDDIATEARIGDGTDKRPQFKGVPVPKRSATDPALPSSREDALGRLQAYADKATEDGDDVALEIATFALNAARSNDAVSALRDVAAELNRQNVRGTRWRGTLYLPFITDLLATYAATKGAMPLGRLWQPVANAAKSAHEEYHADIGDGTPDANAVLAAITKAAADKLRDLTAVKAPKAEATEAEKIAATVAEMYALAKKLDAFGAGQPVYGTVALALAQYAPDHVKAEADAAKAEADRKAAEALAAERKAEEDRKAEEARKAEEKRKSDEAAKAEADNARRVANAATPGKAAPTPAKAAPTPTKPGKPRLGALKNNAK